MNTITPFLWFKEKADEAAAFYISIFKEGKVISTMPGPNDSIMGVTFEINGQRLIAFNGGPQYSFTEAVSLFVSCDTQEEVDYYWEKLTADGGEESQCGWLKDKYGLSWQIVPKTLQEVLGGEDREGAKRAMNAMLQMKKLDIAALRVAYNGQ